MRPLIPLLSNDGIVSRADLPCNQGGGYVPLGLMQELVRTRVMIHAGLD